MDDQSRQADQVLDWIATFEPEYVVPGHRLLINSTELPGVLETYRRTTISSRHRDEFH